MNRTVQTRSKLSLKRKKDDLHTTTRSHTTSSQTLGTKTSTSTKLQNTSTKPKDTSNTAQTKSGSRFSLVLKKIELSDKGTGSTSDGDPQSTSTVGEVSGFKKEHTVENEAAMLELKPEGSCSNMERDLAINTTETEQVPKDLEIESSSKVGEDTDFKDPIPPLVRRKRKRKDAQNDYIETVEKEQLQLALALSASIGQVCSDEDRKLKQLIDTEKGSVGKRPKKRAKVAKQEETVPPLLAVTSEQAQEMLAQRAQEILRGSSLDNDEIQCTPAFRSSELASNVQHPLPPEVTMGDGRLLVNTDKAFKTSIETQNSPPSGSDCEHMEGDKLEHAGLEALTLGNLKVEQESGNVEQESGNVEQESGNVNKSFAAEFQHFDYPTMWELTTSEKTSSKDYYVPALGSVISPVVVEQDLPTAQPQVKTSESVCREVPLIVNYEGVTKLCSDFRALLGSSLFSDVEIITKGGSVISSHAVILAARSPSLKELLVGATSRPIRLDFADYEERVVLSFLEFVYTGALPYLGDQDRDALRTLAKEWSFGELEYACSVLPDVEAAHEADDQGRDSIHSQSAPDARDSSRETKDESVAAENEPQPCPVSVIGLDESVPAENDPQPCPVSVISVDCDTGRAVDIASKGEESIVSIELSDSPELIDLSQSSSSTSPTIKHISPLPDEQSHDCKLSNDPVLIESPEVVVDVPVTPSDIVNSSPGQDNIISPLPDEQSHDCKLSHDPVLIESPEVIVDVPVTRSDTINSSPGQGNIISPLADEQSHDCKLSHDPVLISESPEVIVDGPVTLSDTINSSPGQDNIISPLPDEQSHDCKLSHDPVLISESPEVIVDVPVTRFDTINSSPGQDNISEDSSSSSKVISFDPQAGAANSSSSEDGQAVTVSQPCSHVSVSSSESKETQNKRKDVVLIHNTNPSEPSPQSTSLKLSDTEPSLEDTAFVLNPKGTELYPACDSDELFSPSPQCAGEMGTRDKLSPWQPTTNENKEVDLTTDYEEFKEKTSDKMNTEQLVEVSDPVSTGLDSFMDEVFAGGADVSQLFSDSLATMDDFLPPCEGGSMSAAQSFVTPSITPRERMKSQAKIVQNRPPPSCANVFTTPLGVGRYHLETDDDITPMSNYHSMVTPALKERCAKFGVKPLPKRKMIAKLEEIYEYTHPLVDGDGEILEQTQEPPAKGSGKEGKGKRAKKTTTEQAQSEEGCGDLKAKIKASICANKKLYEDILLYKPLELSVIHSKLKESGIAVAKEKLRDILDQWCVTFTIPRHVETQRTEPTD